ncbi:hypothetical protein ACN06F_03040 [Vreelandella sp. 21]|uniref:hypothetical protein n=1 Tax=Vreelandella sp. 21 TaxID=3402864 RepID=UPI003D9AA3CE
MKTVTLSQGDGEGFTGKVKPPLECEAPYHLNKPILSIVAKVTEAIHKGKALSITYVWLSRSEKTREMVPHTLVDNDIASGVMKVEIRAATARYLLRLWNVDCSKAAVLKTPEFYLWLKNYQTLCGVGNLAIASGFDMVTE